MIIFLGEFTETGRTYKTGDTATLNISRGNIFNVMNDARGSIGTFFVTEGAVQEICKDTNLFWDFAISGDIITASCTDTNTTRNNRLAYKVLV